MNLVQLLKRSQFHGAKRLADPAHRWWWLTALLVLLGGAGAVLAELILRYFRSPTIIVRLRSVQDSFPFPAVLVYPQIRFVEEKMDEFMQYIRIPAGLNATRVRIALPKLAAFVGPDVKIDLADLGMLEQVLAYNDIQTLDAIERLLASCEESIIRCGWRGDFVNCSELFSMELSGDGFCCVFNGRSLTREIAEGVDPLSKPYSSLWFTDSVGPTSGLTLVIKQGQSLESVDLSYKWLALQVGGGYVDVSINGTALSPREEVWAGFVNQKLSVSADAKSLGSGLRRCRLSDEEALQYFPIYTRKYCLLECEMTIVQRRCGCLKPTHPLLPGAKLCDSRTLQCARHAALSVEDSAECSCPPACEFDYDRVALNTINLNPHHYSFDAIYSNIDLFNATVVRAFVLSYDAPWFERRPIYTAVDLFSSLGGVFNVYLGCSVLTILELAMLLWHYVRRRHSSRS